MLRSYSVVNLKRLLVALEARALRRCATALIPSLARLDQAPHNSRHNVLMIDRSASITTHGRRRARALAT